MYLTVRAIAAGPILGLGPAFVWRWGLALGFLWWGSAQRLSASTIPPMCRYSDHSYPEHYICVPCRFSAKGDFDAGAGRACPTCREPMVAMGRDFAPPRKQNHNQWRKLELLIAAGINFRGCGCSGPGPRPRTLADTKRYLQERAGRGQTGRARAGLAVLSAPRGTFRT